MSETPRELTRRREEKLETLAWYRKEGEDAAESGARFCRQDAAERRSEIEALERDVEELSQRIAAMS